MFHIFSLRVICIARDLNRVQRYYKYLNIASDTTKYSVFS